MYSFSLESIMQHSCSPIRLLNFLTSILQVTNREIKRDREDDTQSYQQQKKNTLPKINILMCLYAVAKRLMLHRLINCINAHCMEKGWDINQFFCELFRVCILFAGHIQPAL